MSTGLITEARELEERVLQFLDKVATSGNADPRWFATGRTDIEKGFMSVVRSVERPGRTILPVERQTDETAWLIEHGDSPASQPLYFSGGESTWTSDHLDACRFVRKVDAEAMAYQLPDNVDYRVAEHAWS